MIQDIGEHAFDNSFRQVRASADSWVLSYADDTCLMAERASGLVFPRVGELGLDPSELTYLFRVDDEEFFLPACPLEGAEGFSYEKVYRLRFAEPRYRAYAAVAGLSLSRWYAASSYCGRCGHRTEVSPVSREKVCPACGNVIYPRIQPAVICGVTWGDRILLTKYAGREYTHFALVAGFNEIGETLEETCHREVMEEVGLRIRNLRFYKDQPWPFTDTLLVGFFAELDSAPDIEVDHSELKLGTWARRDELPDHLDDTSSLTNEMIMVFRDGYEARVGAEGAASSGKDGAPGGPAAASSPVGTPDGRPGPAGDTPLTGATVAMDAIPAAPARERPAGGADPEGRLPHDAFGRGNLELAVPQPETRFSLRRASTGETLELSLPCVVGRGAGATCHVVGNDAISREHAEVFRREGSVLLRDLGAVNGTFVNGVELPARGEAELDAGDVVRLADEDFTFVVGE